MGIVAWYQGDFPVAASLLQQSLKLHYELGDKLGISNCLEMLGRVASSQSITDPSRAQAVPVYWELPRHCLKRLALPCHRRTVPTMRVV